MVEVKAIADNNKEGCNVSISIEGSGREILEETIAVVKGAMGSLKEESFMLHMLAIKAMADDPTILLGDDAEDADKFSYKDIKHITFREGVN